MPALVIVLFMVISLYISNAADASAFAANYSNVLEDLRSDGNFKVSDYPDNSSDYSIKVISIAESTSGELYIYVYQPSHATKDLTATSINISTTVNDDFAPKNYKLRLLNTQGVFDKYLVENFKVLSSDTRYYNIPSIFRKWDKSIDGAAEADNTLSEVSCAVGSLYTAKTVNGAVSYECVEVETIEVTKKYCGHIRYLNGFKFYIDQCDAWYVAFDTDKPIDALKEADVEYVQKWCKKTINITTIGNRETYGEPEDKIVKLSDIDKAETTPNGLFAKKYTWNRIEKVSDFIANEDLTNEAKGYLNDKKWVLRFAETSYKSTGAIQGTRFEESTIVSDVTILRLKFETDGKVYNLGVVDNKQSANPDRVDNKNTFELDTDNALDWVLLILGLIVLCILIILLFPLLKLIVKAVANLIALPFKAIGSLFKRSKRKNE